MLGLGIWRQEALSSAVPSTTLNTGAQIPRLGFGTYLANGDELYDALLVAFKVGYRHVDTAAGYYNEEVVAAAIADSGVPREEYFVTTKLWCDSHGTGPTRKAISKSLKRLQTAYIDLYLIHVASLRIPPPFLRVHAAASSWRHRMSPLTRRTRSPPPTRAQAPDNQGETPDDIRRLRRESWLVMEEAYRAGRLRAIGVSNFEPRHIEALLRNADGTPRQGAVVPAVNQIEAHAYFDQRAAREYCERQGIVIEAYGGVSAGGLLEDATVQRLARKYRRTPAQISLRHTLQSRGGAVVLAKSLSPERIEENGALFDFELTARDCAALDALAQGDEGRNYWDNSDVP